MAAEKNGKWFTILLVVLPLMCSGVVYAGVRLIVVEERQATQTAELEKHRASEYLPVAAKCDTFSQNIGEIRGDLKEIRAILSRMEQGK